MGTNPPAVGWSIPGGCISEPPVTRLCTVRVGLISARNSWSSRSVGDPRWIGVRKRMQKRDTEPSTKSNTQAQKSKPEAVKRAQKGLEKLHRRIDSRLDELHADFRQLETELKAANQESLRGLKDRIEGSKRKLQDILKTANRVDWEWD